MLYQALQIYKKAYGKYHSSVKTTLQELANTKYQQGYLDEADSLVLESIAISELASRPNDKLDLIDHISTKNNLARLYITKGRLSEAKELAKQTVMIARKHYDLNHNLLATSLDRLGSVYIGMGEYIKAEKFIRESLDINVSIFGWNHQDSAFAK